MSPILATSSLMGVLLLGAAVPEPTVLALVAGLGAPWLGWFWRRDSVGRGAGAIAR